mgnify:CR=1 FL=1
MDDHLLKEPLFKGYQNGIHLLKTKKSLGKESTELRKKVKEENKRM